MIVASRGTEQFVIRFPDGLRERIKKVAAENGRSMNAEIIFHLRRIFSAETEKAGEAT